MNLVLLGIFFLWAASEVLLSLRRREESSRRGSRDRSSLRILWASIAIGIFAGLALHQLRFAPTPLRGTVALSAGCAVLLLGAALRWWAIVTLGRFFSVTVTVREDHRVIRRGPYSSLRHPSYTGLLVSLVGVGIAIADWLGFLVVIVPSTIAIMHRIGVEEQTLLDSLGEEYRSYCRETKRLFPGIY